MAPTRTDEELADTPIAKQVERLQDDDRTIWIAGWNEAGTFALIVDDDPSLVHDGGYVTIASAHTCNGIGRWECSLAHYRGNTEHYTRMFPRLP